GFYDESLFFQLEALCPSGNVQRSQPEFMRARPLMQRIEPQSANKAIRTEFLRTTGITFPNGHFFEDMYFHTNVLTAAQSVSFVMSPCFTYFRRYLRPQITATAGDRRFDAIAVTKLTLESFSKSLEFHDPSTRVAVLASCLKIVAWCEASISHHHRIAFRRTVAALLAMIDPLYLNFPPTLTAEAGSMDKIRHYLEVAANAD
ncbi:MAG: hypothetical protein ABI832_06145, partial [bacterium]